MQEGAALPATALAALRLAVQAILHRLGGRECQLLRRLDGDGFPGRRIASVARRRVLDLELAKAVQRDFLPFGCCVGDGPKYRIDELARIGLRQFVRSRKCLGEFGIVHKLPP
jgi:hypothetical protein